MHGKFHTTKIVPTHRPVAMFVSLILLTALACQAVENLDQRLQPFETTPTPQQSISQVTESSPSLPAEATPTPIQAETLRSAVAKRDFRIGTAFNWGYLNGDPEYRDLLIHQFNLVTPENEMTFGSLHPAPDRYDFATADEMVDYARQNGMLVRGGSLVWDQLLPDWLLNGNYSREQVKQILHDYIHTVVSHFRGKVAIWDPVNEAISADGQLRDTFWSRAIGPQYIALAFKWAHEADPDALLFYNDFNGEGLNRKSDAIYALVQGLQQAGIPIDGVGWQMHALLGQPPSAIELAANFKRLADLGVEVAITEMDVRVGVNRQERPARLLTQAEIYRRVLRACLDASNCNLFEVWGVTDHYSWYNVGKDPSQYDAPLLFDDNGDPKPSFYALLDELNK
jgi:endo-1,4-beta-xylanase